MLDPLVVARNSSRSFPAGDNVVRSVLHDVDCLVLPGDRIALTGPSGSGKSTLLAILAGLDVPSSGEVWWPALAPNLKSRRSLRCHVRPGDPFLPSANATAGTYSRSSERPPGISVVFQSPSLLPALDVRQNVLLPLVLTGETRGIERQARQLLEVFEVLDLADRLPGELSGGQAQRVAVARAWMTRPRLLLADEPTGQLDHATAGRMLDAMLHLASEGQTAIVIASHDEAIATRMEKIWHLDHGRLMPSETREAPA